jgi:ketosteroid isomerase-like protein
MPAPAHVQAATLQQFLDSWKKWDAEEWLDVFADDFTQVTMPFRLGIPSRTRAEVEQVLPALIATVKSYEVREIATSV